MSPNLKYVSLTVLRSTNNNITKTILTTTSSAAGITVTTKPLHLSLFNSKLKIIKATTTTTTTIPVRNYHQFTIDVNSQSRTILLENRQQQYLYKTAVKNTSLLTIIKNIYKSRSLSSFHKYKRIMDAPPGVFNGSLDRFNGVTIDSSIEYNKQDNFPEKLKKSLEHWQSQKRRAIWFHVKTAHSEWVPHLTKMNFEFHHAKEGMVVLCRWLPEHEYPNLPVYSHTMLGVGGLVVNDKNEVLVVSERFSLIPNSWKLPGGYAEPHENIVDAAIREVREETGIESVFNTVISLRHAHGGPFGCSDIYCVVALTPTNLDLQRCEREIAKVQWMPCDEYLQHPNVHETNRHFLKCYLDYKKRGIRFICEKAQHQILKKEYCLYYMKAIEDEENKKHSSKELQKL